MCDLAAGVNDGHVRAGSVAVPVMVRIAVTNQCGKGQPGVLGEHTPESPATGDGAQKVVATTVKGQLVVARNAQDLTDVKIGIALVDGLIEWVGLLKTDLIGRKVDGVTPSVNSGKA